MSTQTTRQDAPARDRILDAAYDLFSRRGIRAVGIDAVIEQSGVARMTLYRHFASKEQLALAYLERRDLVWTRDWLQAEVERRADDGAGRLLAIFDVLDAWFQQGEYVGCAFIRVLLETADDQDAVHEASRASLERIRDYAAELARDAGAADPDDVARQWAILMQGAIVSACAGDLGSARRARAIGELLLAPQPASS